jgi:hypothetical protein
MMTTYCTQSDIERLLSSAGVLAFADHDEDGVAEVGVVDDCIVRASEEINLYCRQRYSEAGLASSSLVTRWATILGACFVCELRGNPVPASLEKEANRLLETILPNILAGTMSLPGIPFGNDLRPGMSNLAVDRRYRFSKVRRTGPSSTNQQSKVARHDVLDIVLPNS